MRQRFLTVIVLCSVVRAAQQAPDCKSADGLGQAAANGTVMGHVYLDDAKSPGRKATVSLEPAAPFEADEQPKRGADRYAGPITLGVEAEFDGSYRFTHVPAGSYFVVATCPGYISPYISLSIAESRSGYGQSAPLGLEQRAEKERVLAALPKVNVQSDLPVSADVMLERGAAVSGTVTYDDGGPAAGLNVEVLARAKRDGKESWEQIGLSRHGASGFLPPRTDDRGNYRISGLPPGKYMVEVSVEFSDTKSYSSPSGGGGFGSNAHRAFLPIYSGSTPRKKDAAVFLLQQREERTGEDILIPMSRLHTIRGDIVSARDGHVVNAGQVDLLNADDHMFVASQNLTEDDPSFTFSLIFEGKYILSSTVSSDVDYLQDPGIQTQ
ncbi:carboxypeptidase-like regulatory domain-containing protein [Occallatibacter savannae]|uniref:carboxypeptidase-like regulatory domain-containing protein n=1 Tax=Occallatibacter savannae TaxID=1002691 RepID=UPI0013A53EB5|nr:carboxypeptidase-like regulatory domain-containing protein [Occallatibacter savannae]